MRDYPVAYAAKNKDEQIRLIARSGGIFQSLVHEILRNNGVVYGCALNENHVAVHCRVTDESEAEKLSGSKYVQSDLQNSFYLVRSDLEAGKTVLFSGTPCQIDGLKGFLGEKNSNLVLVDIVCHGVPSPKVWSDYINWVENKKHKKVISANFRDKKFGWHEHIETLNFSKGEWNSRIYTSLFYGHCIIRPSCFNCPYKSIYHPSDITLADFWGIDKVNEKFNDDKGVSFILINNDCGKKLFDSVKDDLDFFECSPFDCSQTPLYEAYNIPEEREQFWQDYYEKNFQYIAKMYGGYDKWGRLKGLLPKDIIRILKIIKDKI